MLVLTRRKGQQILIDDSISVMVLEIRGSTIRLGIQAPEGVTVIRSEPSQTNEEVMPWGRQTKTN